MGLSKIRTLFFSLFFCSSIFIEVVGQKGFPIIKNYSPKDYDGSPQIWACIHDKRGIMYFGSNHGLLEFDGKTWRSDVLGDGKRIRSLAIDSTGILFVGRANDFGRLHYNDLGKTEFISFAESIQSKIKVSDVRAILVGTDQVYFFTYPAIYIYNKRTEQIDVIEAGKDARFSGNFIDNDMVYVWHSGKGLTYIDNKKIKMAPHGDFFKDTEFENSVVNRKGGQKIIVTRNKGIILYNTNPAVKPQPFFISDPDFLKNNSRNVVYSLGENKNLIGTAIGALLIDDEGKKISLYNEETQMQNSIILSIGKDQSQNIWLGTSNGITKIEGSQDLTYFNKLSGLKGIPYKVKRINDKLYVCTDYTVYCEGNGKWLEVQGLPIGQQWDLIEFKIDGISKILVGNNFGIFEITGLNASNIYHGSNSIFLHQSKIDQRRIFSTDNPYFISLRYEDGRWINEGKLPGLNGLFRGIVEENDGTLWVGSNGNGAFRIEPNYKNWDRSKVILLSESDLRYTGFCYPYFYDDKILFATNHGFYQYERPTRKLVPFCEWGKAFCETPKLFQWRQDSSRDMFIAPYRNQGDIYYLKAPARTMNKWIYQPFRRLPSSSNVYEIWPDANMTIWIGTADGLFKYDEPKDKRAYDKGFSCLIRKVIVSNDSTVYWGGVNEHNRPLSEVHLDYEQHNLTFDFAAPFFDQEENTKYSFQLVGYDESWSSWGSQTTKQYTNLREGSYTFNAKARNIFDKESVIASYTFYIAPPWYRSWWAYLLYLISFVFIIVAGVSWRTRRLRFQNLTLEELVLRRTESLAANEEELKQNNEELMATLENLRATQKQLLESEKMASLGQLSAGIAHEINNPLTFISGGIDALSLIERETLKKLNNGEPITDQELREKQTEIEELIQTIQVGVDRTSRIVKSLRTFSSPSDEIPEIPTMDVVECVETTLTLVNSKIKEHRITVIKNFGRTQLVKANIALINQVLINIIDNAIQALGGITGLRQITITTEQADQSVVIKIKDNGPGIPEEFQNQIMNPFFTTKEVGKGTGLGLSISFGIIKKHKGKLTFTSKAGEGTEFVVALST
jgi:signal transduction histidine kinase